MADQHKLKQTYAHIEADEAEMQQYRTRLKHRLNEPAPAPWWSKSWYALPVVVAAAVVAFMLLPTGPSYSLDGLTIEALQQLALDSETQQSQLLEQANELYKNGTAHQKSQARVILCTLLPEFEALEVAQLALITEENPQYRVFYLETILDRGDEYLYGEEDIETLMDKEENAMCLALYKDWLKLT